jgi:hypothetical protein
MEEEGTDVSGWEAGVQAGFSLKPVQSAEAREEIFVNDSSHSTRERKRQCLGGVWSGCGLGVVWSGIAEANGVDGGWPGWVMRMMDG